MSTTTDRPQLLQLPDPGERFGYTDEHDLARQAARRVLSERCPMTEIRRLHADPLGHDPALWKDLAGLGWVGLTQDEQHGGAGLDELHLALLLEEMGRVLLPSPFFGCQLALSALEHGASAEQRSRWCAAIAAGELTATLGFTEPGGSWEPDQLVTSATPNADGFVLSGIKTHVPCAQSAALVIVPAREPSGTVGLYTVQLPSKGVQIEPEVCVDSTRRTARVVLEGVHVARASRLEGDGLAALRRCFVHGYVWLAAEMVGAAEGVLVRTRDYAIERQQFGRSIGAFQAVKHPIVNLLMGVELSRSLALGAAIGLGDARRGGSDAPSPRALEAAARMAKAQASDVLAFGVQRGVQLHGGYGFTWDCDMHLFFKRMLYSRGTLGDAPHHRRHLAALLLDGLS